ncbi:MAG: GH92 family glycosyl hydrolase [Bacteroidota bacterium]
MKRFKEITNKGIINSLCVFASLRENIKQIINILNQFFILSILTIVISACSSNVNDNKSNLKYVDPYIGGMGHLLHPTRPNVQLPNQAIRMHPIRADFLDDQISYFPLSMISHREGKLFGILPGIGNPENNSWNKRQTYDHDLEIARPFYFSTYLIDDEITAEFVPGKKAGFYRFTYPGKGTKLVKLHINHDGKWKTNSNNSISGIESFEGMSVYVYAEFNQNAEIKLKEEIIQNKRKKTSRIQPNAWLDFKENNNQIIEFKYAISYISIEQAKKNLAEEIPGWDLDKLKNTGQELWAKTLDQIQVKGGTEAQKRTFYTSLYRTYERMINISENEKYYSAYDSTLHNDKRNFYVDDWVWDTYLAQHPLRMILKPEQEADMLQSYVRMYMQSGWMPQFPLLHKDKPAMHGFHSTIVFLDAYRKGIRNYDIEKAYEGMKKNAAEATMIPWVNGEKSELDVFYREKGYFPALKHGEKEFVEKVHWFEKRQSVAITMAHSYDDWALAEMAKDLGKTDDYTYFNKQSKNYRNLYNADKKLMWPKDSEGNWIDIDPKFDGGPGGRDYYDENNGYTYAWQVQHNIPDLIELMGGNEKFIENLDQLFREDLGRRKWQFWAKFPDATGLVGQFSMGNEPSFHIPYLYNYAGQPWKTQKRIRFLLDAWFQDNIFGIPGDEDGGGMTAFVVFSSMGFYPVTPGLPIYTIGSPVFEEVAINLPNGNIFTMKANNCSKKNKYIQSAKLNGKLLNKPWFTHEDLINGATIELEMGMYPNKELWDSRKREKVKTHGRTS